MNARASHITADPAACQGYISEIAGGEASTHGKLFPERQQVYYGGTAGTDETIAHF